MIDFIFRESLVSNNFVGVCFKDFISIMYRGLIHQNGSGQKLIQTLFRNFRKLRVSV